MESIPLIGGVWGAIGDLLAQLVERIQELGLWAVFLLTMGDSFGLPSSGEFAMLVWSGLDEYPLLLVILIGWVGAAVGDNCAYWGGRLIGNPVIRRVISEERRVSAQDYIHRHGAKAIVGGRMIAAVRTKVQVLAGAAHYPYLRFVVYDAVGCLIWAVTFGIIGRVVGDAVGVTSIVDRVGVVAVIGVGLVVALAIAQRLVLPRLAARRVNSD
ncbi:MAG: DedA family protein [Actinomycetota bacterium]